MRNTSAIAVAIALWLATAGQARAAESSALSLYPVLIACTLAVIAALIWFNRSRQKPVPLLQMMASDIVFEATGAGYCILDHLNDRVIVSPYLHVLLDLSRPVKRFDQVLKAFTYSCAEQLEQAVNHLKGGKASDLLYLTLASDKYLECRLSVKADEKQEALMTVIWFYDINEHYRQRLRTQQENEKLKTEMKSYSTILNMAPYPIWQHGSDLRVQFYNLSYSEAVEDAADASGGRETPELDKKVQSMVKTALANQKPVSDRRHIVIGGERRLYHITELPVPQENISVGFAIDMSELEKLQAELDRHISAQDDLLESSASAMAIYGPDMRLKSFNYAFVALWKLDELWLDSQPTYSEILEALREKRKLPEQANFQLFKQQQARLFTTLIEPREEFFYLPDGKVLRVIAIPHALGGILFAYEDVTDRLALERSYNTLIAVQRETLDHLHEGVAVFGEDGRLKLNNPGYLTLWHIDTDFARSEPHIKDIVERCKHFFVYDDWDTFKKKHIEDIQVRELRYKQIERSDGKVIGWRKVPLPDGATLITYLDITDSTLVERSLRERNEALQEADRLKTEFLANVSYELRSPLTSISGFSEMLSQEYFGQLTEKQKEYVQGIHQSSQHLMQLINDILDLASVEAGYMRLEISKFDVYAMMKSVLSLTQERAREHNLTVDFKCPSKIGKMTGDETRIKQILFNLLSNAIKYSEDGQAISLGAREEGDDGIVLWVEDEGQGVSPEEREAIFSKFYKGKNQEVARAKTSKRSGTGLGLSIVKSFIEMHGGTVELVSEPGKGARFECHLQRHNPELQQYMKKPYKVA